MPLRVVDLLDKQLDISLGTMARTPALVVGLA
jgi:hypothetical protein